MRKPHDYGEITITNFLKDGTVVQDMTGYKVPYNEQTAMAFRIIEKYTERARRQDT